MQQERIYLKDYKAPTVKVDHIDLAFDLALESTVVTSRMKIQNFATDVFLNGKELELATIKVNGKDIVPPAYEKTSEGITLFNAPKEFVLEIVNHLSPAQNTALEGLYISKGILTTQCEAQGFRRITYFPDRPDVLTKFKTTLRGDKKQFPVMLSNGNRIESKDLPDGRHEVVWEDPSLKPCYLFAIVAGNLGVIRDRFTTKSGKGINLEIYSAPGTQNLCDHAMSSLKKSMKWDEDVFGREYDLNDYMIVAIDDFNAGAMENKGLNVFNSRLVFASDRVATDEDHFAIESVIAHEYFHNWTGNRITLRDWFHLSLKEGLTVFRDQQFSSDMSDRSVQRLKDVEVLKLRQFSEDAGPNAHPVRPESCLAVDNFFTATIYEKGSEVIRMLSVLLGRKQFLAGMDLYFRRHDGQAVTIEDFVKCFEDTSHRDLTQFRRWYNQKGTPVVTVQEKYDATNKTYTLSFKQDQNPAVVIPVQIGFLNNQGQTMTLANPAIKKNSDGDEIFELSDTSTEITFTGVTEKPVPSLFRQFSAPVYLQFERSEADHVLLAAKDQDGFNRKESFTTLLRDNILGNVSFENVEKAFSLILADKTIQPLLKATIIRPPQFDEIVQREKNIDVTKLGEKYLGLLQKIAVKFEKELKEIYLSQLSLNQKGYSTELLGLRALKNCALGYLAHTAAADAELTELAKKQLENSVALSDVLSALSYLIKKTSDQTTLRNNLFAKYSDSSLTLQKIYATLISQPSMHAYSHLKDILNQPSFDLKNPNNVYATLRSFGVNTIVFHQGNSEVYDYYLDWVSKIDQLNPQVSARLMGAFNIVGQLTSKNKSQIREGLGKLLGKNPSANLRELSETVYGTTGA